MPDDRPTTHQGWMIQQLEQRTNALSNQLDQLARDLREEIRRGDNRQSMLGVLEDRMREVRKTMDEMTSQIRSELMSREDFRPYRNGFIAVVTAVGLAVLGALLKLVIIK